MYIYLAIILTTALYPLRTSPSQSQQDITPQSSKLDSRGHVAIACSTNSDRSADRSLSTTRVSVRLLRIIT